MRSATVAYDNCLYGLPVYVTVESLLARRDIFESNALAYPTTLKDLVAVARRRFLALRGRRAQLRLHERDRMLAAHAAGQPAQCDQLRRALLLFDRYVQNGRNQEPMHDRNAAQRLARVEPKPTSGPARQAVASRRKRASGRSSKRRSSTSRPTGSPAARASSRGKSA